jgi:hypothetical protein
MSLKKGIFELHSSAFATPICSLINVSHLTDVIETLQKIW